jgi:hypothetical protein
MDTSNLSKGIVVGKTLIPNATRIPVLTANKVPIRCIIKLHIAAGDTVVIEQSFDNIEYDTPVVGTYTVNANAILDPTPPVIAISCTAGFSGNSYFTISG